MTTINGFITSSDNFSGEETSSSSNWGFITKGDTIRLISSRNPASNADGVPGEFCFGSSGGEHYLYYCVAADTWKRVNLSSY